MNLLMSTPSFRFGGLIEPPPLVVKKDLIDVCLDMAFTQFLDEDMMTNRKIQSLGKVVSPSVLKRQGLCSPFRALLEVTLVLLSR